MSISSRTALIVPLLCGLCAARAQVAAAPRQEAARPRSTEVEVPVVPTNIVDSHDESDTTVVGLTERTLRLPGSVSDDVAVWRGFVTVRGAGTWRDPTWRRRQDRREHDLRSHIAMATADERLELQARLDVLSHARETFTNPGQVYDALLLDDGRFRQLLVDANRNGRLDDDPAWDAVNGRPSQPVFRGALPEVEGNITLAVRFHEPAAPPAAVTAGQIDPPGPSADRAERIEYLHALDGVHNRKQHLPRVIAAADAVAATIDGDLRKRSPEGLSSDQQKMRQQLIDALYRKGRALAYMELPDVVARHPIVDQQEHDRQFEQNFQQLSQLVDTTGRKFFLLHIRRDRRRGHHGQAIRLLNRYLEESPDMWLFHKKRRDLYGLLGWDDWQSYEHAWMLNQFPEQHLK